MSTHASERAFDAIDSPVSGINVKKCLSGSAIKMIAVISMIIDHMTAYILVFYPVFLNQFGPSALNLNWYTIIRHITRIGFPLFCFGIVEGYIHTHDRRKYGLNILIFGLLSELPWDLLHEGKIFAPRTQNVFFTLFLGYLGICVLEKYRDDKLRCTLLMVALMLTAFAVHSDYGAKGMGLIVVMYIVRKNIAMLALSTGALINPGSHGFGAFSAIPIALYNGERGFIKGKFWKYFFYLIYPGHLLLIYFLQFKLGFRH